MLGESDGRTLMNPEMLFLKYIHGGLVEQCQIILIARTYRQYVFHAGFEVPGNVAGEYNGVFTHEFP